MSYLRKVPDRKLKSCVYSKSLNHHGTRGKSSTGTWFCQNIGRKWKSEVPMAEKLLHENFMAQAFEESSVMGIILKCCLENTTPIYYWNWYFSLVLLLSFGQNPWLDSSNESFVLLDLFLCLKGSVPTPSSFFPSLSAKLLTGGLLVSWGSRNAFHNNVHSYSRECHSFC